MVCSGSAEVAAKEVAGMAKGCRTKQRHSWEYRVVKRVEEEVQKRIGMKEEVCKYQMDLFLFGIFKNFKYMQKKEQCSEPPYTKYSDSTGQLTFCSFYSFFLFHFLC